MPVLDAKVLDEDPRGADFLRSVLETSSTRSLVWTIRFQGNETASGGDVNQSPLAVPKSACKDGQSSSTFRAPDAAGSRKRSRLSSSDCEPIEPATAHARLRSPNSAVG